MQTIDGGNADTRIYDIIQINDWGLRRFLTTVLSIQFAIWGIILWNLIGVETPYLKPVLGFLYLAYLPGVTILRILRLHSLGRVRTLCYGVGLSLFVLMITGLCLNTVFNAFGWENPLSIIPLLMSMTAIVLVLLLWAYLRDREYSCENRIPVSTIHWQSLLPASVLVATCVSGVSLFNSTGDNSLLLITLGLIACAAIVMGYREPRIGSFYPLVIWSISIALLWHVSLGYEYLYGWDIQHEYYISNIVATESEWNPNSPYMTNGMLSIVVLAPAFSSICGLTLTAVFKVIYPAIFSLVPVGLYLFLKEQTGERIAFFSVFFFMSLFTFYLEMVQLARQEIAELFLVLIVMVMFDKRRPESAKGTLLLCFGFALVVSHYSVSYYFAGIIVASVLALRLAGARRSRQFPIWLSYRFAVIYVLMMYMWYTYVASSTSFDSFVQLLAHIKETLITEFLSPESAQGIGLISAGTASPLHDAAKYIQLTAQALIAVGIVVSATRRRWGFRNEYLAMAFAAFLTMVAGIAVPFFASSLNASRLYHLGLLFLAPFLAVGVQCVVMTLSRITGVRANSNLEKHTIGFLGVFVAAFLLFNSGFVYEVANDRPVSAALNESVDGPHFNYQEYHCVEWLFAHESGHPIYSDAYRYLLVGMFDWEASIAISSTQTDFPEGSYVFEGTVNIATGKFVATEMANASNHLTQIEIEKIAPHNSVIFDNGGARILVSPS